MATSGARAPVSDALLEVRDVAKAYDGTPALRGVSLRATQGTIVCLLGPSGCGKTTLLRLVAGIERADSGSIRFEGRAIDDLPPHRRGFGLMFQDYALFPHRDVAGNVAFGLRMQGLPRQRVAERVAAMLDLVGLAGYERRRVFELSGGERQRVALARSLAPSPRLLMLDEPLGALDRTLRERLLDELRTILRRVGVTSLYVTHDQAEAFALADWLVLLRDGRIAQQGSPEQVYQWPSSPFVARFLGHANLVEGRVAGVEDTTAVVDTALGRFTGVASVPGVARGSAVVLVLRPEAAALLPAASPAGPNRIAGTLAERSFRGSYTQLTLRPAAGPPLVFELGGAELPPAGAAVTLELRPGAISMIPTSENT